MVVLSLPLVDLSFRIAARVPIHDVRRAIAATSHQPGSSPVDVARAAPRHDAPITPSSAEAQPATEAEPPAASASAVTIFYGTDRAIDTAAQSVAYSAARSGRLTLGRATVAGDGPRSATQAPSPSEQQLVITQNQELARDAFVTAATKGLAAARHSPDEALVIVHGFNTNFETAIFRAAELARDLAYDGPVFVYSWPSVAPVVDYAVDVESAAAAQTFLTDFLRLVRGETGAHRVNIIASGLAAVPLLDALAASSGETGAAIANVVLAAPDLPREAMVARASVVTPFVQRVTLYAAASDRALNISRRYVGAIPRAGDVPEAGPLVIAGIETVDVTALGTSALTRSGPRLGTRSPLVEDIATRLATIGAVGQPIAPPPGVETVATARGVYQRYPSGPATR